MAEYHQIGKYVLLKELPESPLGRNFRAAELGPTGLNRIVYLTRLIDEVTPEVRYQQVLQAKFDGIRGLLHEGITKPYEVNTESGVFVSQEYIEGFSFKSVLNRCVKNNLPFSVDYALYAASRLCNTLEYAHSQTVAGTPLLHGGLTPYNVFFTFEGEVKVIDWGIVAATDGMATARNVFLQRYQLYLSPGQTEAKPTVPTSDVFQIGLVFYEMITGAPLYTINRQENIDQMIERLYTDQKSIDGKPISDEIIQILSKALAQNPTVRYPTVRALREDLDTLLYSGTYLATATKTSFFLKSVYREEIKSIQNNMERELSMNYAPYVAKLAEPTALPLGVEELSAEEITGQHLPETGSIGDITGGMEIESDDDFKTYTRKRQLPVAWLAGGGVTIAILAVIITLIIAGSKGQEIRPAAATEALIRQQQREQENQATLKEQEEQLANLRREKDLADQELATFTTERQRRQQLDDQIREENRKLEEAQESARIQKEAEDQRLATEQKERAKRDRLARLAANLDNPSGTPTSTTTAPPVSTATTVIPPVRTTTTPPTPTGTAQPTTRPVTADTILIVQSNAPGLEMTMATRVAPKYPRTLRRLGLRRRGKVQIILVIGTTGAVESARILSGDKVFHQEALKAVQQWTWTPPTQNGKPVKVSLTVAVNF